MLAGRLINVQIVKQPDALHFQRAEQGIELGKAHRFAVHFCEENDRLIQLQALKDELPRLAEIFFDLIETSIGEIQRQDGIDILGLGLINIHTKTPVKLRM